MKRKLMRAEGLEKVTRIIDRYAMEPADRAAIIMAFLEAWDADAECETDANEKKDAVSGLH